MVIATEEWHRRIPEYRLTSDRIDERGGMLTLSELSLDWEPRMAGATT
jgi:hypothetical protein